MISETISLPQVENGETKLLPQVEYDEKNCIFINPSATLPETIAPFQAGVRFESS